MHRARGWIIWAVASALPLVVAGCAALPRDASLPVDDPGENLNRKIMTANLAVMRPAAHAVDAAVPGPLHDRLQDFNANLKEPRIFLNSVLQGRVTAAAKTGARFLLNSIVGFGVLDIATREGLPQQTGDFGQTLFVWGVGAGPYVVEPYLGPATLRDAVGSTVDMFTDPVGWLIGSQVTLSLATSGLDATEKLGRLKQAEDASIDFYSFVRSSYYQTRRAQLREAIGQSGVVDSPALDDPEAPAALDDPEAPATPSGGGTQSAACPGQDASGTCAAEEAKPSAKKPVAPRSSRSDSTGTPRAAPRSGS